jgi:glycosyltransferase involved in cell wall biosynthesis
MKNPKVSIIVPVYNVKEFLPKCLDSILSQTIRDMEVITIDDGSSDGSAGVLDSYAESDNRITVVHVKNGGVSKARNIGLDRAKGDFIGFVDPDDYVEPQMYSTLVKTAEEMGADCVQCSFDIVRINGEIFKKGDVVEKTTYGLPESIVELMRQVIKNSVCTKLYKREGLSSLAFVEKWHFAEDFRFNSEYLLRNNRICTISDVLYHYQIRDDSITHTYISENNLKGLSVFDLIKESPALPESAKKIVSEKELAETMKFLNSSIGHRNISQDWITSMVNRVRDCRVYIKGNCFMTKPNKWMAWFVCTVPKLYVRVVTLFKRIKGIR